MVVSPGGGEAGFRNTQRSHSPGFYSVPSRLHLESVWKRGRILRSIQTTFRECLEKGADVSLRGAVGDEAISFPATDCFALLAMTCTATFQTPFIVCRPHVSPVRLDRQRLRFLDRILFGVDWSA